MIFFVVIMYMKEFCKQSMSYNDNCVIYRCRVCKSKSVRNVLIENSQCCYRVQESATAFSVREGCRASRKVGLLTRTHNLVFMLLIFILFVNM